MSKVDLKDVIHAEYFINGISYEEPVASPEPQAPQKQPIMMSYTLPWGEKLERPVENFVAINGNHITFPTTYEALNRDLGIVYAEREEGFWVLCDEERFYMTSSYKMVEAAEKDGFKNPAVFLHDEDELDEFIAKLPTTRQYAFGFDLYNPEIGCMYYADNGQD